MSKTDKLIKKLKNELSSYYPQKIHSVLNIDYKKINPLNERCDIALVLKETDSSNIDIFKNIVSKYRSKTIQFPYVFTKSFIESSLDSFPLEFLYFESNHTVLLGENILENISINKKDVRLQCERELKGKGLHLKSLVFRTNNKKDILSQLGFAKEDFFRIFLGLIFLKDENTDISYLDASLKVAEFFNLNKDLFKKFAQSDVSKKNVMEFYFEFYKAIDTLSEIIDKEENF